MVTKNNPGAYIELFEKANKALGYSEAEAITNIDDYFTCIKDLSDYQKKHPEEDPIFLVLPTDEPTFDIDANTRKITVPKAFANGVSVQGDEAAEIIYFAIDRYFDATDLYNKEILIQWKNAKGDQGLAATWHKCLTVQPGKIVFGWPITSEITESAGNVTFSVRFYQRHKDEDTGVYSLLYSFSTLSAVIKINPSLDFDIIDQSDIDAMINKNKMLEDRLINSERTDITIKAADPVFETNLPARQDLVNGSLDLQAQAHIPEEIEQGAGTMSYSWVYTGKDEIPGSPTLGENKYVLTEDLTRQGNDIYYYKDEEGTYRVFANTDPKAFTEYKDKGNLFELFTKQVAKKAGHYKVIATNTYGRGNSSSTDSIVCEVPFADMPALVYTTGKNYIIKHDAENTPASIAASVTDNGELTYAWLKGDSTESTTAIPVPEATADNIAIAEEGFYFLKVMNHKNNDITEKISDAIRATNPAQAPVITQYFADDVPLEVPASPDTAIEATGTIKVALNEETPSDKITYQWFRDKKEDPDEEILDATTASYTKGQPGEKLYVKITNEYNTDTAVTTSRKFVIVAQ